MQQDKRKPLWNLKRKRAVLGQMMVMPPTSMKFGRILRTFQDASLNTNFTTQKSGQKTSSPSGNRTLVSRVTGGDTDHYTNEDLILKCSFVLNENLNQQSTTIILTVE